MKAILKEEKEEICLMSEGSDRKELSSIHSNQTAQLEFPKAVCWVPSHRKETADAGRFAWGREGSEGREVKGKER